MNIEADFRKDIADHWHSKLAAAGCDVPSGAPMQEVGKIYFSILFKMISPRPRRIYWSAELKARTLPPVLSQGLKYFAETAEQGGNLNIFLSRSVLKGKKHDLLDNDWGIKHFHLGEPGKRRFVERTKELLYARVETDAIYLLDVLDHRAFSAIALIEILDRNWPQLLEPFYLEGFLPAVPQMSDEERNLIRKAGAQPMLQINGKLYAPPGGGYASTGISSRVMMQMINTERQIDSMETEAVEQAADMVKRMEKESRPLPSAIIVKLIIGNDGFRYKFFCLP